MAAYSHSTSPSLSALPISSTTSRPTPAVEVVPWVVYEYCAPEETTTRTTSRTTTSTGTSGSSLSQKVRVVGRGGFGSRPRRSKSVSFSNPGSNDAPPTAGRPITQKPLPKTPDEKSAVRVVGRGGAGSRPRNISSAIQQSQGGSSSSSTSPPPETARSVVVGGGRGGAGSRPRAFKQKEKKAPGISPKWLEKGKAKLFPSNRYYGRPSSPCDSVDSGSVIFAPPPHRHVNSALPPSSPPSEHSIPCSIPSTPASTLASTASSSDLDSPVPSQKSLRRLSKLYRKLGERFTDEVSFMAIKPPVLGPPPSMSEDDASLRSSSQRSASTFTPGDDSSSIRTQQRESFSISSRRESSLIEPFIDDKFESASFVSESMPKSPMTFFEPPVKPNQTPVESVEKESEGTYIITYQYEPLVTETPFSRYHKYPDVPQTPSPDHLHHDFSIGSSKDWSGDWNSDIQHVIDSLRHLR